MKKHPSGTRWGIRQATALAVLVSTSSLFAQGTPPRLRKAPSPAKLQGQTLTLTGLTMTVPSGWKMVPPDPSKRFAPVAIFSLPKAGNSEKGPNLRITYFPRMKGMNEANIDRWLRQVRQDDGNPTTRKNATITTKDLGEVHLTIVDVSGTVREGMGRQAKPMPKHRLIAAIIDHPKGPHFVRVSGDSASMKNAEKAILQFLQSAKVR